MFYDRAFHFFFRGLLTWAVQGFLEMNAIIVCTMEEKRTVSCACSVLDSCLCSK